MINNNFLGVNGIVQISNVIHLSIIHHKKLKEMFNMGTTFIVMTTLKLAAMGGVGIALTTAFQYFHNFDFKPNKKKGGDSSDIGDILRDKSRHIS
jgi:mannose/fructose/N-acetylgalactosamine-specific phosphotransferase system component IIC